MIRIIVPVDPQQASPNKRGHWAKLAKVKHHHKETAALCWMAAGRPRSRESVHVEVIIRRGRFIDQDNALACCKALIDGLFKDAITPDDSPTWVKSYTIRQEVGSQWKQHPEVEFIAR